jgi:hypothetical protein
MPHSSWQVSAVSRKGRRISRTPLTQRRTEEQAEAFAEFRELAAPLGLRVTHDEEGFPIIPGRFGCIEWTGGSPLAVYSDRPRVFAKLFAVDGIARHQIGDTEIRLLFPPDILPRVARLIRAHRKSGFDAATARQVGLKTAFKAPSSRNKPIRMVETGLDKGERNDALYPP